MANQAAVEQRNVWSGTAENATEDRFLRVLDDPRYAFLVEVQDLIGYETAVFWRERGVRSVQLPITTSSVSSPMGLGSDSLPVRIDLFGVPTYLADSMQFMLEYGCRLAPGGCYYVMPSFRGEDPDATHLNQFFHSEAEIPGGLADVMAVADAYLRRLASAALGQLAPGLDGLGVGTGHVERLLATETRRISFDEAVELLGDDERYVEHGAHHRSITRAGEQRLLATHGPALWLTHFDRAAVPFYQAYDGDGGRTLSADLLLGPGEIIGCGERHVTGEQTRAALADHRVPEADYRWYTALKDHHPLRTAGFGMGVERFLMWLLDCPDIRWLQLAERYNGRPTAP
ncbi:amino acid--tRNA ligase-related protein [Streptomyces sp. DSM 44915]|uniref:Amino acid--tRNA ligase-related protein n=1 Tax=Streptomyces chisholmiae TaxID=3075540 RepID=A0ABU2JNM1_9ACTN|nr:amino acid--tRNA ligase-related protein [Streptomyces sp. DSM 44915]MDT0266579.1 amino acid--tRNA ligase-related protein [Streptomyces sp. DSM 44915]